jgi:hypothetical protein
MSIEHENKPKGTNLDPRIAYRIVLDADFQSVFRWDRHSSAPLDTALRQVDHKFR